MKHDPVRHGEPKCVLLLIAQVQEHKPSTPVRPCLDHRAINKQITSHPGLDAAVCADKLRCWWQAGPPSGYHLMDISEGCLQVHVHPDLFQYQVVIWQGELYVMERMGFGLSVGPKVMGAIVKWITRKKPQVDNYVDDLYPTKTWHGQKRNCASTGCGQSNLSQWCTHEYWAYRYRPTLDNQASGGDECASASSPS